MTLIPVSFFTMSDILACLTFVKGEALVINNMMQYSSELPYNSILCIYEPISQNSCHSKIKKRIWPNFLQHILVEVHSLWNSTIISQDTNGKPSTQWERLHAVQAILYVLLIVYKRPFTLLPYYTRSWFSYQFQKLCDKLIFLITIFTVSKTNITTW
jgi:hypothetical protein